MADTSFKKILPRCHNSQIDRLLLLTFLIIYQNFLVSEFPEKVEGFALAKEN